MYYKENQLSLEEYQYLRQAVSWNNYDFVQAEQALKNACYDIVAYDDNGKLAGMGRLLGDGLYYLVVDIVVVPKYQGKSVGTGIVRRLLQYVEKQIPNESRASVILVAAQEKEPFYEKLGFKKIPHEFCGSGMRMVIHKGKSDFHNI